MRLGSYITDDKIDWWCVILDVGFECETEWSLTYGASLSQQIVVGCQRMWDQGIRPPGQRGQQVGISASVVAEFL